MSSRSKSPWEARSHPKKKTGDAETVDIRTNCEQTDIHDGIPGLATQENPSSVRSTRSKSDWRALALEKMADTSIGNQGFDVVDTSLGRKSKNLFKNVSGGFTAP